MIEAPGAPRRRVSLLLALALSVCVESRAQDEPLGRPGRKKIQPEPIYTGVEPALAAPSPGTYIEVVTSTAIIDRKGEFELTPTCREGRQLLGGGYFSGASSPYPYAVSILSSFPSSDTTWKVVFHSALDPRESSAGENVAAFKDVVVAAHAYCLNAPAYPLALATLSADNSGLPKEATVTPAGYQGVAQSWSVACPPGSVLTGGGFAVAPPIHETDAISNTDLTASLPAVGEDGVANGWRVSLVAHRPDTVRRVTAYARCAGQGLTARKAAVLSRDLTGAPTAAQEHDLSARCPGDAITTGGGHDHRGDWLIPRPLFVSRASPDFRDWDTKAFGAYQTTRYEFRPCDTTTAPCLEGAVIASCYEPPDIPYINVRIVSPPDGYHFDVESYGSDVTDRIVFTAKVYDRAGAQIEDAEVDWSYSTPLGSVALGSGNVVVARLPAGQTVGTIAVIATARYPVRAGKLRGVLTAQDSIRLTTGTVP